MDGTTIPECHASSQLVFSAENTNLHSRCAHIRVFSVLSEQLEHDLNARGARVGDPSQCDSHQDGEAFLGVAVLLHELLHVARLAREPEAKQATLTGRSKIHTRRGCVVSPCSWYNYDNTGYRAMFGKQFACSWQGNSQCLGNTSKFIIVSPLHLYCDTSTRTSMDSKHPGRASDHVSDPCTHDLGQATSIVSRV